MKRTRKALSLILSLLMLVSGLTLLASAADTYTPIPGTDCYWVKTNNFVSMSEIYMNERYGTSGSIRFYKLLSISIVDKGETGAYTIGQDDTFVKFTHSGKAVVSATAQIYKESTNSYTKDICSFTFYVSNSYKYLVIFEPNGGTGTASIYSGSATILKGDQPHFARTGYTLDGWANGPKNSAEYTGNVTAYEKAPQVLYAHWKPNTYTLSFNANGGTVSPTSKTVTYGSTFGTLPTPTRAGYRFDGWYGTASGGGQFTASSVYSFTSNLMVYAHWTKLSEISTIAVTGVSAPAVGAKPTTTGIKVPAGVTVNDMYWTKKNTASGIFAKTTDATFQAGAEYGIYLSVKAADGYTLAKTVSATVNGSAATTTLNYNNCGISYRYAALTQPTMTVTLDPVGGTVSPTKITVTQGGTYGTLPTPKKDGYTFEGWYVPWNGGDQKVDSTYVVQKSTDHTLTAHWKKNEVKPITVTVTFDPNGGTLLATEKLKTVTVGTTYGSLPVPARSGYTFDGWYSGSTKITASSTVVLATNHTLTAKWAKEAAKAVTVSFNASPGFVSPTTKSVTVGSTYGSLPIPFSSGRTFLGWYDGDTQITALSTVTKTENHTLTAKWEIQTAPSTTVTVTFFADGGSVSPASKSVEPGKAYGTLPTPTKKDCTFLGWYTADNVKIIETTVVPYSVDHTLTAKWQAKTAAPVTVAFNAGDGATGGGNQSLEPGKPYGELPTPSKAGYVFLGWYTPGGVKVEATDLVPAGGITLTAKWEAAAAPHTEHTYDAGIVTKASTCKESGTITYTCLICGSKKTEELPLGAHTFTSEVTKPATCTATGEQQNTCSVCGTTVLDVLPKLAHSYKTEVTPATLKKSGEETGTCIVCGETSVLRVISRPKAFSLAATKFTYNGKAKKPTVTVKDAKGNLIDPENYTLKYSNNKQVGTAKVKITFKGDYSGSKTLKFQILPKKTAIQKLTAGTKAFKATWKQISSGDGYQLQYSTNKSFSKNVKTITIKDASVTARTVKNLQSGKTYYVRIRTLQVVDSKTYCAAWSKAVKVKTK